uniref:Uncharacterized protein n=1 Tax=Arundo donax TaxID=35708 RepID=A0A0A9DDL7_ARUDO
MWIQSRLSFLTCGAASHKPLYIPPHLWPKEMCSQNILHLFSTKMTYQSSSMCLQSQEVGVEMHV